MRIIASMKWLKKKLGGIIAGEDIIVHYPHKHRKKTYEWECGCRAIGLPHSDVVSWEQCEEHYDTRKYIYSPAE